MGDENNLNVVVDYSGKKVGEQIKRADKRNIPYVIALGEDEIHSNNFVVKELSTGKKKKLKLKNISTFVKKA